MDSISDLKSMTVEPVNTVNSFENNASVTPTSLMNSGNIIPETNFPLNGNDLGIILPNERKSELISDTIAELRALCTETEQNCASNRTKRTAPRKLLSTEENLSRDKDIKKMNS